MKHEIKKTIVKVFTGKHRNWAIVTMTMLALLIATAVVSSVQVRITAEQPSTFAQSQDGGKSAGVPNVGGQPGTDGQPGAGNPAQGPSTGSGGTDSGGTA